MINLSNNYLWEIPIGSFVGVSQLECLDFSNNLLRILPWKGISKFPKLKVLVLKGNMWNCSCDMSDVLYVNNLVAGSNASCHYPASLKGMFLADLGPHHFEHCPIKSSLHPNIFLSFLILIIPVYIYLIHPMIQQRPPNSTKHVGEIEFDYNALLGTTGNVFKGKLKDGRQVAVKRHHKCSRKELEIHLKIYESRQFHENVVQYLWFEHKDNNKFMYLALELCDGDLHSAIIDYNKDLVGQFKPEICFLHIARGLNYLHTLGIQHRDIKPQNILWKKSDYVRFLLSDFDVGHFSDEESAHKVRFGTKGWTSNELWNVGERKASVDIFSLGCVYHFVITRGGHPFGKLADLDSCQDNICSKENNFNLDDINEHYKETPYLASLARDLISKMISFYPVERPEALDVLHHPLLWTSKDRLSFFDELGKIVEEKKMQGSLPLKKNWNGELPMYLGKVGK